jgi:hypothetical protein
VRCRVVFASFAGAMLVAVPHASSAADESVLTLLGTYTTGLADIEDELTSGEVAALRGDKLYVTNASDVSVDIVDVSDPASPVRLKRLDLSPYGDEVTSVAVGQGLVARRWTGAWTPAIWCSSHREARTYGRSPWAPVRTW